MPPPTGTVFLWIVLVPINSSSMNGSITSVPAFVVRPEAPLCPPCDGTRSTLPIADAALVLEEVQAAADIFRAEANVRLIPVGPASFETPFRDDEAVSTKFIHDPVSSHDLLDVSCGVAAWREDFWGKGPAFNIEMTRTCFWGNARRLLGYGSPITMFVVRSIDSGATTGCSLGPLTDYLTVVGTETDDKTTIAHETGHACGLWHVGDQTNLMFASDSNLRRMLTNFQAINLRNSRHVTYL